MKKFTLSALVLASAMALTACGGSSSDSTTSTSTGTTTTTTTTTTTPAVTGVAAYAGNYSGTVTGVTSSLDSGSFSIAVDSAGNVAGDSVVKSLPWKLAGTVDANGNLQMGLYSVDMSFHGHSWSGVINKATGAVSGTWQHANGDGVNGTFAGSKQ